MANPYDSGGPITVGPENSDPGLYDYLLGDGNSASTPSSNIDFSSMSANEISKYAQEHPEWYANNASLVDYWLNEKSYDRRSQNNIISQYDQLVKLGVNPVLAMSILSGSGTTLSGGASASSDSFFASKYSSDTSKSNKQSDIIVKLISIGISVAALMAALL